ncbi:MAG: GNAT family N-acetyltransferase, partial [Chitinophagaceae bacterium]|nr:GNAT family N-acetyltransferase [Chitinophagaceae bacterium]
MILEDIDIVPIQQQHNASIATIIRTALEEFNANKLGTVYFDASTDTLSELFNTTAKSQYYIALHNNMVVGGAGIFPTESLPNDTIELVKMYLHPSARNIGLGKKMIQFCMASAKQLGFTKLYLETLPEL